ncbi:MAG TPA: O-antigen ligase family protein [Thermoanaerobaculia bacterium]|nr:O-antigen ligase family protein [Thermoanaerobaculia bacterium]
MRTQRSTTAGEVCCLALFLVWLAALPLPFGGVIEAARVPMIAIPLALCAIAAVLRLIALRDRSHTPQPTPALLMLGAGAALFLVAGAAQLVPLTRGMLELLSPESLRIWNGASRVAELAGAAPRAQFPISVDPAATALELFRLVGLLATFLVAALLVRNHARRRALAIVLCLAAAFEALYGVREAALQRYEIWGWVNTLIFHRVTGTFVNPNHFGHYLAIILPMALFLVAVEWREAGGPDARPMRRIAALFERGLIRALFGVLAAALCLTGLLLSQSRGAMLATAAGVLFVVALLPGRRAARVGYAAASGLALVAALALYLGPERTLRRFVPTEIEVSALEGRRIAMRAALALWQRFPIAGSGHGTFDRVVAMDQTEGLDLRYHHAHNDYLEIAVTAGTLGLVIGVAALLGGAVSLLRMTFGETSRELTWRRRAFQAAVLASLSIAAVHALFDFNFFIPANPATLAAMAGAAVSTVDHDRRSRR